MERIESGTSPRTRNLSITEGIFFSGFYLYVWLFIGPRFIYHSYVIQPDFPVFFTGWFFLKGFLVYPGGPVEYVAAFLSQGYYYSWLGALIITLTALLIYLGMRILITLVGGGHSKVISYIPAIGLLIIYNRYHHPLAMFLALLTAVWLLLLYGKICVRIGAVRCLLFLVMFAVLYYIAGGASLLFAVLAGFYEVFVRRKLFFGGFYLLFGFVGSWLIGVYILELKIIDACLYLTPFHWKDKLGTVPILEDFAKSTTMCLYFFIPVVVMSIPLWRRLVKNMASLGRTESGEPGKSSVIKKTLQYLRIGRAGRVTQTAVLIVITTASLFFSFDSGRKGFIHLLYFTDHEMWYSVLEQGRKIPTGTYDIFVNHYVNLALYHTGRFSYDMFSYRQQMRSLFAVQTQPMRLSNSSGSNIFMELGLMNLAEKQTHECLENTGSYPPFLKRLAMINIVKGRVETARVFLRVLGKDLIYGRQAKDIMRRLDADPQLSGDDEVELLRSIMSVEDWIAHVKGIEENSLLRLLERNRHNRMAFEYLMAHYLLTGRPKKVAANIGRLDDFDYKGIPRHYEEAILLHKDITREEVDLHGRYISGETLERLYKFKRIYNRLKDDVRAAGNALRADFGDSYFFYYVFYGTEASR
jgi:hypothetical protein